MENTTNSTADYKAKIRKLLALAGSSNENEAKAALLTARALMAKHKLTEADCTETAKEAINRLTDWTATKRTNPWMISLASAIADHHCCKPYTQTPKGKQTHKIGFVGLPDDLEVCIEIFNYAARFVKARNVERRKSLKRQGWGADFIKDERNSYAMGFINGMKEAYERQERERQVGSSHESGDAENNRESWALVMVIPQEVTNYLNQIAPERHSWNTDYSKKSGAYSGGYEDGRSFVTTKALKGATA